MSNTDNTQINTTQAIAAISTSMSESINELRKTRDLVWQAYKASENRDPNLLKLHDNLLDLCYKYVRIIDESGLK